MIDTSIYNDIAKRTGGDIYIGVVGPVRTGKSTLIKRFLESSVIPLIRDEYEKDRTVDELPQSAAGKTVMTTEPKFVPDRAIRISVGEGIMMNIKLVDCVGYVVDGALGLLEGGEPRMVRTPWHEDPVPFAVAAEVGTNKVINEHATVALLVTTDGSIGELERAVYEEAEARVASELRAANKPFVVVLNSANPESEKAHALAYELEEKYGAPVALINCLESDSEDFGAILGMICEEFPVKEVKIKLPSWALSLDADHWLLSAVLQKAFECGEKISKMSQIKETFSFACSLEYVDEVRVLGYDLSSGSAEVSFELNPTLYYRVMSEIVGCDIEDDSSLISLIKELSEIKKRYDKVSAALSSVNETGYGIVMPDITELTLKEPQIVKNAGGYGVRLSASANSIHMIRASIETEINPIVGTEEQSEALVKNLLSEFEEDPGAIWNSKMFGKSLYELVNEGLCTKLQNMPDESRQRLGSTLEKIINEGSNGLICIIL